MRTSIAWKLEKFEGVFQALPVGSMNNFILTLAGILCKERLDVEKKILSEAVLDFYARILVVHWQIYVILRVSASWAQTPVGVGRWHLSWSWCSWTLGCPLGNLEQSREQIWQRSQRSHLNSALVLKFNAKHLCQKENKLVWDTCPVLQFNKDCLSESFTFLCSCSTHLYLAHTLDLLSVYISVLFFSASSCSSLALNTSPCPLFSPSHEHTPTSPSPHLWHYRTTASNSMKPLASNQRRPKCRKVRIN